MDNKKPCQIQDYIGRTHFFANLEQAERHARAIVFRGKPIEILQDGKVIARVSADTLKRTRIRMYD